ncbi:hypothetical protein OPQ81_002422 [Rhizoctonia solani]|nr:hypothetical protein OPQ81_002422 [Rhizoctonia solani]
MAPGSGLTRKASTTSMRSTTNGFKPTMSSPLAAGSKPATPAPPKLDTGSVSAKVAATDPSQPSPSSASWLSVIPGIRSNQSNKVSATQPTTDIVSSPVEVTLSPVDNKASSSEATPSPKPEAQSPVSSTDTDHDALVLVTAPTSPVIESNSNTYRINSLAAQHASSWVNTPASWLAWMASAPGLSTSPQPSSSIPQGGEVMDVDFDEDEVPAEDNGRTPVMTTGTYDRQASQSKGKRPAVGEHSLSVDSVVPALPNGDQDGNGTASVHPDSPEDPSLYGISSGRISRTLILQRSRDVPIYFRSVSRTRPTAGLEFCVQGQLFLTRSYAHWVLVCPVVGSLPHGSCDPGQEGYSVCRDVWDYSTNVRVDGSLG